MSKDYYKILGVTEFDSAETIKNAYRKLARRYHPDIAGNAPDILMRFKEINEAYEILSNPIKKTDFDKAKRFYEYAHNDKKQENKDYSSNPQNENKKSGFNWEEFWNKKNREKSFNNQNLKAPKRGQDVNSDIEISVLEAMSGVVKTINMLQTEVCPKCKGKKFVNGGKCDKCSGKGEFNNYKKFTIKIPAGIKNGSKIRLAGEGGKGINGGNNGDLYLTIHVIEYKTNKTEGLNILKTVSITPFEAVLGTDIKINTINGEVSFKIAPYTQNGQKIRLNGCGITEGNKTGDMIVSIEIQIPKSLSVEEINLYKKLKSLSVNNIHHSDGEY